MCSRGELPAAAGGEGDVGPGQRVPPLPERRQHRQLLLPVHPGEAAGAAQGPHRGPQAQAPQQCPKVEEPVPNIVRIVPSSGRIVTILEPYWGP